MPVTVLLPALSPTMEKGNLVKWLKKEGEKVCSGDVIAEVETDKATMEVECFDDGTIGKILVDAGSKNVHVNAPIAIILLEGEDLSSISSSIGAKAPDVVNVQDVSSPLDSIKNIKQPLRSDVAGSLVLNHEDRIKCSPLARRIAKQSNLDLSKITGSGPSGRIIKNDVLNVLERHHTSNTIPDDGVEVKVELSTMRAMIAERLSHSKQTIPHYYLTIDCNVGPLIDLRKKISGDFSEKVTINDFIIKAVSLSLKKHPEVNSSWCDTHILRYSSIDVAFAVALKGGLVTPILRKVDKKSVIQISREVKAMVEKAKSGLLSKEEYQGGSITVSNLGMYGIKEFIAIINPPQSAILAVGTAEERVVVVAGEMKVASVMTVTLSADHRVVDGALGAEFISSFKYYIEKPLSMLIY